MIPLPVFFQSGSSLDHKGDGQDFLLSVQIFCDFHLQIPSWYTHCERRLVTHGILAHFRPFGKHPIFSTDQDRSSRFNSEIPKRKYLPAVWQYYYPVVPLYWMCFLQRLKVPRLNANQELGTRSALPATCTAECCSRCEFFTCILAGAYWIFMGPWVDFTDGLLIWHRSSRANRSEVDIVDSVMTLRKGLGRPSTFPEANSMNSSPGLPLTNTW